jgi:hypothetical protein
VKASRMDGLFTDLHEVPPQAEQLNPVHDAQDTVFLMYLY